MSSSWIGLYGHRIPAGVHRLPRRDRVEVPDRAGRSGRCTRRPCARWSWAGRTSARSSAPRPPRRSSITEYGADGGAIGVAERVILQERVPRVGMRLVDGDRRHHQRRLRVAAVLEHEAGALRVDAERLVVVVGAEVGHEVQQVGEVGGQVAEVAVGEVERCAWSRRAPRPCRASTGRRSGRCPTRRCRRRATGPGRTRCARRVR